MFRLLVTIITWAQCMVAVGQDINVDSFKIRLLTLNDNIEKVKVYQDLAWHYPFSKPDSAIKYSLEGLKLAKKLNLHKQQIDLLTLIDFAQCEKGNFALGLEKALEALEISKNLDDGDQIAYCNMAIAYAYSNADDYDNALKYFLEVKNDPAAFNKKKETYSGLLGDVYYQLGQFDSSYKYIEQAYQLNIKSANRWSIPYLYMGKFSERKGQYTEALQFYRASISGKYIPADYIKAYLGIAGTLKKTGDTDSSIYYAELAYTIAKNGSLHVYSREATALLRELYKEKDQPDSAYKYLELMMTEKDNLFSRDKLNQVQFLTHREQQNLEQFKREKQQLWNRILFFSLVAGLIIFIIIVSILVRNSRFKQKSFDLLQNQKAETDLQKSKAVNALEDLKATQSQLIQSAKMASLGELSAGIAHEIQNPLNFVNNFSEVNSELIKELKMEAAIGNMAEVASIANDIESNSQKINHHGKRAESIVKGMLQHSHNSPGHQVPTDINALADEYLRLSYHGVRAKDKDFNAIMNTDFDASIGKINIVPQDIGRVLLNLYNNAFYAVRPPDPRSSRKEEPDHKHIPTVWVRTKKMDDKVLISVRDNGPGIPKNIVDKIFQPFFTTKPTGQGTGLGLSLSYDIVKAHGGEIKVNTKEARPDDPVIRGEGTEFVIQLPC